MHNQRSATPVARLLHSADSDLLSAKALERLSGAAQVTTGSMGFSCYRLPLLHGQREAHTLHGVGQAIWLAFLHASGQSIDRSDE